MNALSEFASFVPWLAALSALLGVVLLISSIRNLLRMLKAAELLRLPLQEIQELAFASAGPVVLCVEGPLLTRRFVSLSYKLRTGLRCRCPGQQALVSRQIVWIFQGPHRTANLPLTASGPLSPAYRVVGAASAK